MLDLDPDFLSILVCPLSRKPVVQVGDWLVSTDPATRRRYRILEDGTPVMLVEEGEEMPEAEWRRALESAGGAPAATGQGQE